MNISPEICFQLRFCLIDLTKKIATRGKKYYQVLKEPLMRETSLISNPIK